MSKKCPCDESRLYMNCCGLLHGGELAKTAEDLMRSRYSAYAMELLSYLVETTHPSKRTKGLESEVKRSFHKTTWRGLEILKTSMGGPNDKIGKVEFIAHYSHNGKSFSMQEYSRFKRFKGRWVYFDPNG